MVPTFNVCHCQPKRFCNRFSFSRLVSLFEPASSNPAAASERILRSPLRFSRFLHFVETLDFSFMGSVFSSGSSCDDGSSNGVPVILNVYDLTPLNNYLYWCGLGIFHSGIEVHGLEYGFGAHDFPTSGVFEVEPRNCPGFVYRCSLLLGYINMPPLEFRTFMESMSAEYYGDTYHLISKNCNHFTEDLCLRLTRQKIPGWINRLARLGAICNCLLPESLRLPSVKELPEYHVLSEDGSESVAFIGSHEPMDSDDTDIDKHLLSQ